MAVITLTAAAMPAAVGPLAGVVDDANSNGTNGAAYTFAGGAGAGDTITNTELKKGVAASSRLFALLDTNFASQADLDATVAALGFIASVQNGSTFRLLREAVGGPSATVTAGGATGALRIAIAQSVSA